jgi:predicted nucleic acid-binding protein
MPEANNLFVLDTSALLALRSDEAGADCVETLLRHAKKNRCRVLVSFMTRMEILYCLWREEGEEAGRDALRLVDSFPIEWISCEPGILEAASRFKARGGLSVADCWIGATAFVHGARLVHKDPEFRMLNEISQEFLGHS